MVIITALIELHDGYKCPATLLNSGRYLLTGKNFPQKCGHKYFIVKYDASKDSASLWTVRRNIVHRYISVSINTYIQTRDEDQLGGEYPSVEFHSFPVF